MEDNNMNEEVIKKDVENVKKEEGKVTDDKENVVDRKGFAVASMVLGIIALVLFWIFYLSVPCAILAIIFGILSIKSSRKGMSIAGITTGAIGFVLMVLLYGFIFVFFGSIDWEQVIENYDDRYNDYNYHYNYDWHNYDDSDWF